MAPLHLRTRRAGVEHGLADQPDESDGEDHIGKAAVAEKELQEPFANEQNDRDSEQAPGEQDARRPSFLPTGRWILGLRPIHTRRMQQPRS